MAINPTFFSPANLAGASASLDGRPGLVPAPRAGQQGYFLRGDGTWAQELSSLLTMVSLATGFSLAGGTVSRTLTVSGNASVDQDLTTAASPSFAQLRTVRTDGDYQYRMSNNGVMWGVAVAGVDGGFRLDSISGYGNAMKVDPNSGQPGFRYLSTSGVVQADNLGNLSASSLLVGVSFDSTIFDGGNF